MRRIVEFETSSGDIRLTELSSKLLNNVKVYLPLEYRTLYSNGNPESLIIDDFTEDDLFNRFGINESVFIINLRAKRIDSTTLYLLNRDIDMDMFRYMISVCHMAEIMFDKSGKFINVAYNVFNKNSGVPETIYLFDDDYPFENYLLEEQIL